MKKTSGLIFLFMITYMVSYMTRINFGAIISQMEAATEISKQLLSMSLTGSFITYGAGQVISGVLGDRISPKRLVAYGLGLTSLMNILIPFCQSPFAMLAVWCVNGFAQAFMWPPMVRLMTAHLNEEEYKKAVLIVSYGSSFGTIAVYLLSPVLILWSGWKAVFFFSAGIGIIMMTLWGRFCVDTPTVGVVKSEKSSDKPSLFTLPFIALLLATVCFGVLRDGIQTWMPSYITETYQTNGLVAILSGVILPVFSMLCYNLALTLYRKKFKNPLSCAGVVFLLGTAAVGILYLLSGKNAVLAIVLMALTTGCMHGVSLMITGMVPMYFKDSGNVSTVSGIINAFVYVGSAVSTYGVAVVTELRGWSASIFVWLIVAALGTSLCFLICKRWDSLIKIK